MLNVYVNISHQNLKYKNKTWKYLKRSNHLIIVLNENINFIIDREVFDISWTYLYITNIIIMVLL